MVHLLRAVQLCAVWGDIYGVTAILCKSVCSCRGWALGDRWYTLLQRAVPFMNGISVDEQAPTIATWGLYASQNGVCVTRASHWQPDRYCMAPIYATGNGAFASQACCFNFSLPLVNHLVSSPCLRKNSFPEVSLLLAPYIPCCYLSALGVILC